MDMSDRDTSTVQATKTSFTVLEVLLERGGAGVTEVAQALDIPKSTAHKHLTTLADLGYAISDGGVYDVGLPFVSFGRYAQRTEPLLPAARPEVERLSEMTDEVAGLFVERAGRGFDVYRSDGVTSERPGPLPRYLHCTAPGKAILAELSSERVDAILDEYGLPTQTSQTITTRDGFVTELDRIRDRGIAFDREEAFEGVHGVAVPVTHHGRVRGAVYVLGAREHLTGKWFDENIPGMVLSAVKSITQNLRQRD